MKKYSILWRPEAIQDVSEHLTFISNVSKDAAVHLYESLVKEANSLMNFPERNPIFEMPKGFPFKVRKKVVDKRYLLIYIVDNDTVEIYRVLDARKQFEYLI